MATADQLTARIEVLKAARASGVLSVRHGENMTTFRSVEEMNMAIALDEQELESLGGLKPVRRYRVRTHKDL